MLKILHDGIHANLDLDTSNFTGDTEHDAALPEVTSIVAGRLVAVNATTGVAQLADGALAAALHPLGFVINDAAGYYYMQKPALASGKVPVTFGNCVIVTDQIDTALTFTFGEPLYCGTTGKLGLITNVKPLNAVLVGYAWSAASSASPELTIFVK